MYHARDNRKALRLAKRANDLAGTGRYLFQNRTNGDFILPRQTSDGVRRVGKDCQFVGDSYYFCLLKTGELRMVQELGSNESRRQFVFENNTPGVLTLPHKASDGQAVVRAKCRFVGDDSFFQLLQIGKIKLIEEVSMPDKLITEVPPTVTHDGTVEFVTDSKQKVIEEDKNNAQPPDVLLTEQPLAGVKIID